jgi:hypothetical protein
LSLVAEKGQDQTVVPVVFGSEAVAFGKFFDLERIDYRNLAAGLDEKLGQGFVVDTGGLHDKMELGSFAFTVAAGPFQQGFESGQVIVRGFVPGLALVRIGQQGTVQFGFADVDTDFMHMRFPRGCRWAIRPTCLVHADSPDFRGLGYRPVSCWPEVGPGA